MTQQTTLDAFVEVRRDIGSRQMLVFNALRELGEATNTMIAKYVGLPINCVTPRIKELRELKFVSEAKRDMCPITKRTCIFWTPIAVIDVAIFHDTKILKGKASNKNMSEMSEEMKSLREEKL